MQVRESCLVQHFRADNGGVVHLERPGSARIFASDTGRICATHRILRIVVVETIDVEPKHQVLILRQLVIETSVEKKLAIVTCPIKTAVGWQYERWQRSGKKRCSILVCVIRRDEEERFVFDDRAADSSRDLSELIRNVDRIHRMQC